MSIINTTVDKLQLGDRMIRTDRTYSAPIVILQQWGRNRVRITLSDDVWTEMDAYRDIAIKRDN